MSGGHPLRRLRADRLQGPRSASLPRTGGFGAESTGESAIEELVDQAGVHVLQDRCRRPRCGRRGHRRPRELVERGLDPSLTKWKVVPPGLPGVTLGVRTTKTGVWSWHLLRPCRLAGVEHPPAALAPVALRRASAMSLSRPSSPPSPSGVLGRTAAGTPAAVPSCPIKSPRDGRNETVQRHRHAKEHLPAISPQLPHIVCKGFLAYPEGARSR